MDNINLELELARKFYEQAVEAEELSRRAWHLFKNSEEEFKQSCLRDGFCSHQYQAIQEFDKQMESHSKAHEEIMKHLQERKEMYFDLFKQLQASIVKQP